MDFGDNIYRATEEQVMFELANNEAPTESQ